MTVMILIIAACSSSDDAASPASTAPPPAPTTTTATTAAPTTTSGVAQSLTDDEALAISGDYIDAFNSGDADAVLALFTDDVALSDKYSALSDFGNGDPFEAMDRAFFEQELAWNTAQGTTFVSPECAVTEDGAPAAVTVSCEVGSLPAAEKAVDAPPVPTLLTMVVTTDGISKLASEYVPEFGLARFDNWLFLNHKDDSQGVEYGDWNSVAEAQQGGTLRAQYVAEWAASLEANS